MDSDFFLFALVGFLAQIVDGALGMAYGVISSSVLLAFGAPPAVASAAVHGAEIVTTGISGTSHAAFRNVDRRLLYRLIPAGVIGGIIGAYVLTGIPGDTMRPFVTIYLGIVGIIILGRVYHIPKTRELGTGALAPIGVVGGFMDAAGGGGWGPMVSSSLVSAGEEPRYVVGSVNLAEFFVTVSISATFLFALLSGHWEAAGDLETYGWAMGGLVLGGAIAAPLAGWAVRIAPPRILGGAVGVLIIAISIYQAITIWG